MNKLQIVTLDIKVAQFNKTYTRPVFSVKN